MRRYYTHYWRNSTVEEFCALGHNLLEYVASNQFVNRGVTAGDLVYPVTIFDGALYVVGILEVENVCDAVEAEKRLGYEPLWKAADYLIAKDPTPMRYDLKVPLEVSRELRFVSSRTLSAPKFISSSREHLDQQALRGVRQLTAESAAQLDRLLSGGKT
jgi:hypothetical protein